MVISSFCYYHGSEIITVFLRETTLS